MLWEGGACQCDSAMSGPALFVITPPSELFLPLGHLVLVVSPQASHEANESCLLRRENPIRVTLWVGWLAWSAIGQVTMQQFNLRLA